MVNQCILVGILESATFDQKKTKVILSIETHDRNTQAYDKQRISVIFGDKLSNSTIDLKEGSIIGVKGKLVSNDSKLIVEAEKLTYISKKDEKEEEDEQKAELYI